MGFKTDWSERNVSGQKGWEAAGEGHMVALVSLLWQLKQGPRQKHLLHLAACL